MYKISDISFKSKIKKTPYTQSVINSMSIKHFERYIEVQNKLLRNGLPDEILISRKKTSDGKIIPILTNLSTGMLIMPKNADIKRFNTTLIKLLESIIDPESQYSKLFSRNSLVIQNNTNKTLAQTKELLIHPLSHQKLTNIRLSKEDQDLMKNFETIYPDKEIIFQLSENTKLFIKSFDEGYIYYITDNNRIPNGEYFTVTYNNTGYSLNYDSNIIKKEEANRIFKRYTSKSIERFLK